MLASIDPMDVANDVAPVGHAAHAAAIATLGWPELAACLPYLQRQIALIAPKVIVALGKTAVTSLFGLDPQLPLSQLRGKIMHYQAPGASSMPPIPLVATYHPAYLLRQPSDKRKAWQDLCLARSQLSISVEASHDHKSGFESADKSADESGYA